MAKKAEQNTTGFESSLKHLQEVVQKLEKGDLPLEEAIALYEQGVRLNQGCESELKKAEEKIAELKKLLATATDNHA